MNSLSSQPALFFLAVVLGSLHAGCGVFGESTCGDRGGCGSCYECLEQEDKPDTGGTVAAPEAVMAAVVGTWEGQVPAGGPLGSAKLQVQVDSRSDGAVLYGRAHRETDSCEVPPDACAMVFVPASVTVTADPERYSFAEDGVRLFGKNLSPEWSHTEQGRNGVPVVTTDLYINGDELNVTLLFAPDARLWIVQGQQEDAVEIGGRL